MTEISEFSTRLDAPRASLDPVAFFIALLAAPVLVTLGSFWFFLIPVAALVLGGPIYLVLGTPLLLIYLQRHACSVGGVMALAAVAVLSIIPFGWLVALSTGERGILQVSLFVAGFGLIFGPCWAAAFAKLYNKMARNSLALPDSL